MRRRLRALADGVPEEFCRASEEEVNAVETPESARKTPVATGELKSTVSTIPAEKQGTSIITGVQAGGPDTQYAFWVHEDPEADHPVGQDHFISSTINEGAGSIGKRIANRIVLEKFL